VPFVTSDHRAKPDITIAGDRCYLLYNSIMRMWNNSPRWTTIDAIYKDLPYMAEFFVKHYGGEPKDWRAAADLAWMVFFNLHAMPYEWTKREENGDITGEPE
jgi:hypothetical protein